MVEDGLKRYVVPIFFLCFIVLSFLILRDYLVSLVVGALIAYLLFPLYDRLSEKLRSTKLAGIILSLISVLLILLFLAILIPPLILQARQLYSNAEHIITSQIEELKNCPDNDSNDLKCRLSKKISGLIDKEGIKEKLESVTKQVSLFLAKSLTIIIGSIATLIISVAIILFSVFYFLENGTEIKDTVIDILPMKTSYKNKVLMRIEDTVKAIVVGNVSTAFLQGLAGGLIFFILGIPSSLFWGFLIFIFAFVPAVGSSIIWVPAAVILILKGSILKSIILIAYSMIILGAIDNILKPKLISDRINLSSFVIFLAVLGGLKFFGVVGLLFGPLIIALLSTFIQIYREEILSDTTALSE
ncbi:MAG: AI-2E family transporter [Thermodesulfobacteriota bacterium]|nr:AI-2E family transporter [Thermodesulfobacteriota bacterium]